ALAARMGGPQRQQQRRAASEGCVVAARALGKALPAAGNDPGKLWALAGGLAALAGRMGSRPAGGGCTPAPQAPGQALPLSADCSASSGGVEGLAALAARMKSPQVAEVAADLLKAITTETNSRNSSVLAEALAAVLDFVEDGQTIEGGQACDARLLAFV